MGSKPSSFVLSSPGALRFFSTTELLSLPNPHWQIDGLFYHGGMVALYAPRGLGKSFLALDLALCIATGKPWQGRDVTPGYVLYVAAEGGGGLRKRVTAWLHYHDMKATRPEIAWCIEPVSVSATEDRLSPHLEIMRQRMSYEVDRVPSFVVIDTLARCFTGDENQQEDMNKFVAGIDALRREWGCTVLIVHHTGWGAERERGSSAFGGAADTMMALEVAKGGARPSGDLTDRLSLTCAKQKEAEPFAPLILHRKKVIYGHGKDEDSCVIAAPDAPPTNSRTDIVLNALALGPLTWADLLLVSQLSKATLSRTTTELREKGLIYKADGTFAITHEEGQKPT